MIKKKSTLDIRTIRQRTRRDLLDQEVLRLRQEVNKLKAEMEQLKLAMGAEVKT
jgi:hypothetical protein